MSEHELGGVLVTGAASGIGAAAARHFASQGRRVACLDVAADRAADVAASICASGSQARAFACDVSEERSVDGAVRDAVQWMGSLSSVMSNAGIVLRKSLLETSVAEWDQTMAVNARGAFLVARATVPHLSRSPHASIIMIASVVAHVGFGLPAYTASKGAIVALVRELAGELAPLGIRVNAVSPGTVAGTAVTASTLSDPVVLARTIDAIPLRRVASTADVVAAVDYLASPVAGLITGQTLVVDGGLSAVATAMMRPPRASGTE